MSEKLGQDGAFATSALISNNEDIFQSGMSTRLYLAGMAMQGIISLHGITDITSGKYNAWIAYASFQMADELLKQEDL